MANFIESRPSMSNLSATASQTRPEDAGSLIRTNQWGIDAVLSGFIIQNVSITGSRIYDTTQDQKGAVVSELDYDEEQTMQMEVIGGNGAEDPDDIDPNGELKPGNIAFVWNDRYWKIRSVTYTGAFNDKKRYSIEAVRYRNFPSIQPPGAGTDPTMSQLVQPNDTNTFA